MYATIQRTLFPRTRASRRGASKDEQVLAGSALSSEDVLAEALAAVLQHPPEWLKGEWEAFAVGVAHNKAVDALRASQKGLRGTEHRDRLHLVPGDAQGEGPDGEPQAPLFEVLAGDWDGPEIEYERVEKGLVFRDLARAVLSKRDRNILYAVLFQNRSRKEVGEAFGLTGQRVSQICLDAANRLAADPNNPFTSEDPHEGGDQ